MLEILSFPFMQRAIIAGILAGFLGSYYGVFVVQRKMSFLGSGLAHTAFGGVALGLLLNFEPLWVAIPFTIFVSIAITWLKEKTKLGADTSIGIMFAVSVALGVIFLSLKDEYTTDAFSYLFGSILSVTKSDLIITLIISIATIIFSIKYWSRWAYSTFDAELAKSDRIPVQKDNYILSVLISTTIVISIKLVGIVLISAFLVIPAASSRMISNTFFKMTLYSVIFGVFGSMIGLFVSVLLDIPSGATIILSQTLIFIVCLIINKISSK